MCARECVTARVLQGATAVFAASSNVSSALTPVCVCLRACVRILVLSVHNLKAKRFGVETTAGTPTGSFLRTSPGAASSVGGGGPGGGGGSGRGVGAGVGSATSSSGFAGSAEVRTLPVYTCAPASVSRPGYVQGSTAVFAAASPNVSCTQRPEFLPMNALAGLCVRGV
jgi:hypothetical protein